jgi:type I restriction enzyme S subunit
MKNQYVEAGIPFLRSQNVRPNRFRSDGMVYISPAFHQSIIKSALRGGDVVVVRSGNVGVACVIPDDIVEANCSDLVVVQRPGCVAPQFLCFYLNSMASSHIEASTVGIAFTHFNTKSLATMPIPLPPVAEQHRIVAKVNELMALCDALEASLTAVTTGRTHLLEATLREALQPAEVPVLKAAE